MLANREQRKYNTGERIWVGAYRNSQNIPHWHYDCELIYLERGELDVFCNSAGFTLKCGQAAFVDSCQVHHLHALTPQTTVKHIIFDYELIESFAGGMTLLSPLLTKNYEIDDYYDKIKRGLKEKNALYIAKAEHLVIGLMLDIFSHERTEPRNSGARSVERLKPLLEKIDENLEYYSMENAAQFMCMNPSYFSRLFHNLTGVTFSRYLNGVKTERAVTLLKENKDLSMTEISEKCGFDTIRNFNRIFKSLTGYTPKTLPDDFVLTHYKGSASPQNPTLAVSELLESSDD